MKSLLKITSSVVAVSCLKIANPEDTPQINNAILLVVCLLLLLTAMSVLGFFFLFINTILALEKTKEFDIEVEPLMKKEKNEPESEQKIFDAIGF